MGEPLYTSFLIRSSAALWDWKPAQEFLPSGEKARRSACLPLRRWTWRTRWAFVKLIVCSSMLWTNIIIKGAEHNQLSKEKRRGWLCFSPLQYIPIPPGTLRGVCPCLCSRSAVPLLLRHGGDWDHGDRTWIWRTGWGWLILAHQSGWRFGIEMSFPLTWKSWGESQFFVLPLPLTPFP